MPSQTLPTSTPWCPTHLININTVRVCTEDKLEVVVTPLKQDLLDNGKINIFIAAFTTCHARLRLVHNI